MFSTVTQRPRNIDTLRASAILYGDLGTSKAYVIGLAFALSGYSSFWLILAVSLLTILIGINYIVICKYYPNGGGVYASVRRRSEMISLMGAFFLIADYLVTASLSALSAFNYLGVSHPVLYSALAIAVIGALNYFGPRHTGTLASIVGVATIAILTILIFFSLPYIKTAWHNIEPLTGKPWTLWNHFVGVIVALSGIEAIANTTGIMKLNRGSSIENPQVTKTSTKAIAIVIAEVALYTTFFAFVVAAIGNFEIGGGEVNAPGYPNVRDSMLRYLSQVFVGNILGEHIGLIFSWCLSIIISTLLISAVNTAINGLVALQYIMAGDGEFPQSFQKVNRHGVPFAPLAIATLIPIFLVLLIDNVSGLATLYAVGFVGAIAINLASTSTDFSLPLKWRERILMLVSFVIMLSIEITLFIEKSHARIYAFSIIILGLILRALSRRRKEIKPALNPLDKVHAERAFSILCPLHYKNRALDIALEKAKFTGYPLHVLFIREQSVISESDLYKNIENDADAINIKKYATEKGLSHLIQFHYCITDSAINMIAAYAMRFDIIEIILDPSPYQGRFIQFLRGNKIKKLRPLLSEEIVLTLIS